jgi:hypothetical protein
MSKNTKTASNGTLVAMTLLLAVLLACGPALAGSAASTVDQEQTNTASGVGLDAQYPAAQQFTVGRSGDLDRVSIPVSLAISGNVGDLRLAIQSLNSEGQPSGTVLGTASLPASSFTVGAQPTWRELTLQQPVAVTQGTQYTLVVSGQNHPQDGSFYNWRAALTNPYAGGDAMWINPGSNEWEVRHDNGTPMDFAFKTFVSDVDSPTVTSTTPSAKAKGVSRSASITAIFSEPMNRETLTTRTVSLRDAATGRRVSATVSCEAGPSDPCVEITLDPFGEKAGQLEKNTKYKVTVSTAATDTSGNRLDAKPNRAGEQAKTWAFTTGSGREV